MVKSVTESAIYRLPGLGGILAGSSCPPLESDRSARDKPQPHAWTLRSGVFTPRQMVEGFAPLLDTVVHHLGKDAPNTKPARASLLDNVLSNLATDTRESTLPFQKDTLDLSRREMKQQADRIGKTLVKWADEVLGGPFDSELNIRSPCENHLLTPANVDLMFGRRSQPHLMQLFNEYMHQMVLLRDALLPFRNFDEVLIPIDGKASRGIRHLEPSRAQFLMTLVTKSVTQVSVLSYAKALLAPDLAQVSTHGYGFQYESGCILPAVLSGGDTSLHLLDYVPTKLDPALKKVLFNYNFSDYYVAHRLDITTGTQMHSTNLPKFPIDLAPSVLQNASLGLLPSIDSTSIRQLELRLEFSNGKCVGVDIGQIARGHRYAYLAHQDEETDFSTKAVTVHSAMDILLLPETGLITAKQGGVHIIPTVEPIVALAVLGRLYPENVVLLPRKDDLSQAENAGKGFEPKFIVWGGMKHGGSKGRF